MTNSTAGNSTAAPLAPAGASTRPRPLWLRLLPLLALLGLMLAAYAFGLHRWFTLQSISEHRAGLQALAGSHWVAALAVYVAVYAIAVALSIPGATFLTIAGGVIFGWITGGIAAVLAATAGAIAVFQIARTSLGEGLVRRAGPALARLQAGFKADAFSYLLFLRLLPVFPFWLINVVPAVLAVPLRIFAAATAIGIIPATFAFAFLGEGFDSVLARQQELHQACLAQNKLDCAFDVAVTDLLTWKLIAALSALALLALLPVVFRRRKAAP